MEQVSLADELLAKHSHSTQASSQTLCAVLGAALEVLQSQDLAPTPPALFAATMSSLEKPAGYRSPEVATALCTILSACLMRIPDSLVRTKFVECTAVVMNALDSQQSEAGGARAAVAALGQILAAMDPNDWPGASAPFNKLLELSVDPRPKVRRAAHSGIANTLAAIQRYPVAEQASQALLQVCQQVLPGPEAALRASSSGKADGDATLQRALSDAIQLLNLLKICLPILAGPAALQLAKLLPKMFPLQHPLLTGQTADALAAIAGSKSVQISSKALAEVLTTILESDAAWELRDGNARLALIRLIEHSLSRLHEMDARRAANHLPAAVAKLVPQLLASQEDVRQAAAGALKTLIRECLQNSSKDLAAASRAVQALEAGLGAAHQDSWLLVLSVVEELFRCLPAEHANAAKGLLERTGEMCGSTAQALVETGDDEDAAALNRAAGNALGAAIAVMGPAAVLSILPLNLEGEGQAPRTWLLPLLRQHTQNTALDFWGTELLPLARVMAGRASQAPKSDSRLGIQYRALEAQLWGLLPSFCAWPVDLEEAFRKHAQAIGKAFENREDLKPSICTALERLCTQNWAAFQQAAEHSDGLGFSRLRLDDLEDEDSGDDEEDALIVPPHYTAAVAKRNLACLQHFAKNWLPLLFNAFVASPAGGRAHLGRAISAYALVVEPSMLDTFFKTIVKKLIKATQDAKAGNEAGGSQDSSSKQRCTYMELALMLSPALPPSAVNVLFKASAPALQEKDQAVQKRAYRLLAYVLEQREAFAKENFQEILDSLLLGVESSMSSAKRYRLRCLQAATLILQKPDAPEIAAADDGSEEWSQSDRQKQVISMLVGEIVLCTKEVNRRTRIAAYQLLVGLAKAMHEAHPPSSVLNTDDQMGDAASPSDRGGLDTLFTMILGGLVGSTPHMVSASVMALARLLYEFAAQLQAVAPQLLDVVLSLLRSKSREIIKSVLGFVKVCASKLPVELLQQHLKDILEGILLWSEDSKNKFKLKVRMIVERLIRRLGLEAVSQQMPEAERKLLTHIRKEHKRKQRPRSQSEAGASQIDMEEAEMTRSRAGRTAASQSAWAASQVFSSDEEGGASRGQGRSRASNFGKARTARASSAPGRQARALRTVTEAGDEPMDLLDQSTSRAMLKTAAGPSKQDDEPEFKMDGNRMIIKEDPVAPGRGKRKRGGGLEDAPSDDSDFDDLRQIAGATAALRIGGKQAGSTAGQSGARSMTHRSTAAKSSAGRSFGGKTRKSETRGKEHSGARFAAAKGAGGDVKGRSKVEPYAYWPLDRKMLNKRPSKKVQAKKGLAGIVHAGKAAQGKGKRAKRHRNA